MAYGNYRSVAVEDNGPRRKRPEEENVSLDSIVETTPYQQRMEEIRSGTNTAKPINYSTPAVSAEPDNQKTGNYYQPTGGMSIPPSYQKYYQNEEPEEEPFEEIIEKPNVNEQVPEPTNAQRDYTEDQISAMQRDKSDLDVPVRYNPQREENKPEGENTSAVPESPAETYDAWEQFIDQQEQAQNANDELFRQSLNQPDQSVLGTGYVRPNTQGAVDMTGAEQQRAIQRANAYAASKRAGYEYNPPLTDSGLADAEQQRLQDWVNNLGAAQRAGYEYNPTQGIGEATMASALPEIAPDTWMGSQEDWDNYRRAYADVHYSPEVADTLWNETYPRMLETEQKKRDAELERAQNEIRQIGAQERLDDLISDQLDRDRRIREENEKGFFEKRSDAFNAIANKIGSDIKNGVKRRSDAFNAITAGKKEDQSPENKSPEIGSSGTYIPETLGEKQARLERETQEMLANQRTGNTNTGTNPAAQGEPGQTGTPDSSSWSDIIDISDPRVQNDPQFQKIRDNYIAQGYNPQAAANAAYSSVVSGLQDQARNIANDLVDQALNSIGEDAQQNLSQDQLDQLYKTAEDTANQQVFGTASNTPQANIGETNAQKADRLAQWSDQLFGNGGSTWTNESPFPIETNEQKAARLDNMMEAIMNGTYDPNADYSQSAGTAGGTRAVDDQIPGYNSDGTPNEALQSIMNGEWNISTEGYTNADARDAIQQGNATRILDSLNANDIIVPAGVDYYLASDKWSSMGNLGTLVLGEEGLSGSANPQNVETIDATPEEMNAAIQALVDANPIYQDLIKSGQITEQDLMRYYFKAPTSVMEQFQAGEGTGTNGTGKNGATYFTPSYGQDMDKGVKLPYKKGGYSEAELEKAGNKPYKDNYGRTQYEGYYMAPDGNWYPVDQGKADYYLANGTYNGYTPDMAEYYRTFGTYRGYTPNWRNYGSGGGSYSRSYSGGSSGSYGSPSGAYQQAQRINNIMKNWSF